MGVKIDSKQTPRLYAMMQKMLSDFGLSTYGVKNKYNRVRPFVVHNEATCRADQEAILRSDGSYPSGHTAAGWGWALVFAQINPERADALLKRGIEFGQSRVTRIGRATSMPGGSWVLRPSRGCKPTRTSSPISRPRKRR
jgi:acid phosphatase (class A)